MWKLFRLQLYSFMFIFGIFTTVICGEWSYYVKDHLGSTRMILDESGNIKSYFDYDPFGKIVRSKVSDVIPIYKFSSKELDSEGDLNWYYFDARYYDPEIGRWLSADPLASKYPGWSPYNYVVNNPLSNFDPNGAEWKKALYHLLGAASYVHQTIRGGTLLALSWESGVVGATIGSAVVTHGFIGAVLESANTFNEVYEAFSGHYLLNEKIPSGLMEAIALLSTNDQNKIRAFILADIAMNATVAPEWRIAKLVATGRLQKIIKLWEAIQSGKTSIDTGSTLREIIEEMFKEEFGDHENDHKDEYPSEDNNKDPESDTWYQETMRDLLGIGNASVNWEKTGFSMNNALYSFYEFTNTHKIV